jgi:hypothetical protein
VNGEVFQYAALVMFGNDFLASGREPPELFPTHSSFRYVASVSFPDGSSGTAGWYTSLRKRGVRRLLLDVRDDAVSSAFAGGSGGSIWVLNGVTEVVRANWLVPVEDVSGERVWSVSYRSDEASANRPASPSLKAASAELDEALREAAEFAGGDSFLSQWVESFQRARDRLAARDPESDFASSLFPVGADRDARCVMAAVVDASVFGGMGSWNDAVFEDSASGRRYEEVTARFYEAMRAALMAASNEAIGPRTGTR